jgi:hypothetical protein
MEWCRLMMKRLWKFFKHSSVNCVLSLHYASTKLNIFKQQTCLVFQIFVYHSFGRLPLNNLKSCKKYKIFPNINFIASFICLIIICLRWLWDVNLWKRQNFCVCWLWDASKIIENIDGKTDRIFLKLVILSTFIMSVLFIVDGLSDGK